MRKICIWKYGSKYQKKKLQEFKVVTSTEQDWEGGSVEVGQRISTVLIILLLSLNFLNTSRKVTNEIREASF